MLSNRLKLVIYFMVSNYLHVLTITPCNTRTVVTLLALISVLTVFELLTELEETNLYPSTGLVSTGLTGPIS